MQIAISEQIRNYGVKTKTPLTEAAFFIYTDPIISVQRLFSYLLQLLAGSEPDRSHRIDTLQQQN